jgi:hypothetical protein
MSLGTYLAYKGVNDFEEKIEQIERITGVGIGVVAFCCRRPVATHYAGGQQQ